jgi:hypothetical protein
MASLGLLPQRRANVESNASRGTRFALLRADWWGDCLVQMQRLYICTGTRLYKWLMCLERLCGMMGEKASSTAFTRGLGHECIGHSDRSTHLDTHQAPAAPAAWGPDSPEPNGPFAAGLRIYWPEQDILDGKWEPAAIKKA